MADPASWAPSTVVIMNIFWLSHTNLITFFKKAMQHIPREIIKVDLFNRVVALICRRVFTVFLHDITGKPLSVYVVVVTAGKWLK